MDWEFRHDLTDENFNKWENISLTNVEFCKQEINKIEIKFENFREVLFQNCKFNGTIFNNIFFSRVKFINCEFNNVIFNESHLSYVIFDNSKLTSISISASKLENILIKESLIQYSKVSTSKIGNSKWDDVRLLENTHFKNEYLDNYFYKCELIREQFRDTKLKKCNLKTCNFDGVDINLDDLISSTLSVLNMIEIVRDKGIILED